MSETDFPPESDETENLIHEIENYRNRTPSALAMGELSLEREQIIWDRIQQRIDTEKQEVGKARKIFRIAFPPKD